jgi:hypothetical protein
MEIKVKEILGEKLITRDQILDLRNYILRQKEKKIILDFQDVSFITFSSYDEYLKVKDFLEKENFEISEINLNQSFTLFEKIKNQL